MAPWFSRPPQPAASPDPSSAVAASNPADAAVSPPPAQLDEARAVAARLRQDLADLLKANRQQGRVLERNQKQLEQAEQEVGRQRDQVAAQVKDTAALRAELSAQAGRTRELEAVVEKHATLQVAYDTLDRERQDLTVRLSEVTRSRSNLNAERDRLMAQLASAHATLAARDAEVASLTNEQETTKGELVAAQKSVTDLRADVARLKADRERVAEFEAAHTHLQLENETLVARWDVARTQLAEAEQALTTAQATIKAAQRLSSSVEWRGALDSVLDAASELVRFERGTLALVDEVQEELKVEAARNSPIAVSEMSRFKVGEGIAGWALSHREPVLVRDSRSDARFKASDPKHQPRSFIAVPLLADNEGLGVLTLARSASDPFTDLDLRNLARVATDASNALINARLVDLLKQREDRLTTLVRKARELTAADDIKAVVEFALSSARELGGGRGALLAVRNPKTLELEILGSHGLPETIAEQRIAWGAPAAADVMRTGKPWVSPMREMLPPALVEGVERAGLKVLVSVLCGRTAAPKPVDETALLTRADMQSSSDETSGVLNVYRDTLDPIRPADLDQLKAFAEQVAVAIQNVRRADRVKEQLQASASQNTRMMGRERYINQLLFRIQQLETELGRYKAA
ncbi:MAG: GAF domain-containing protein [Candidatus Dormibacteraeota bacterium]|nr:GAF domain-containing protein [Candidatus Dormibacteraeota bacterium]